MSRRLVLGVGIAAALGAGRWLFSKFLARLLWPDPYEGLDGAVSYSSRKIAAARAVEAEESEPLVLDPLAGALAGPRALASARARQQPAPAGSGRASKLNPMAVRTKWFDDQLEASMGMPLGAAAAGGGYVAATATRGRAPRQVVVLGSGMDSRPWRLKLPAGLHWYEVDRPDVLDAKRELLAAAGAELSPPAAAMNRSESVNARLERKIGSIDHHAAGQVLHPLRAGAWAAVAADLNDPSWVTSLEEAGFDPGHPTVWVAEGLVMYLEPARVGALLRELAAASVPGSALLTVSVTEQVVVDIKERGSASELLSSWKFGCPRDPTQWLADGGWTLELVTTRAKMARSLGLAPELCAFEADPASDKDARSLFIAATPTQR